MTILQDMDRAIKAREPIAVGAGLRFDLGSGAMHAFWGSRGSETRERPKDDSGRWNETNYRGIPVRHTDAFLGWELSAHD